MFIWQSVLGFLNYYFKLAACKYMRCAYY